jgi:hypothetical protein
VYWSSGESALRCGLVVIAGARSLVRPAWFRGPLPCPRSRIVNLVDRQVEIHSGPRPDGDATHDVYRSGEQVPVVLDGVTVGHITIDDILP